MKSIKPFVKKIANAENELTNEAFEVVQFSKVCGQVGEHAFERQLSYEPNAILKELAKRNIDLPPQQVDQVSKAMKCPPPEFRLHVASLGWRPGFKSFVFHDDVVGKRSQNGMRLMPSMWVSDKHQVAEGTAGTTSEWKNVVAKVCGHSTRLMLMVSAAFAAPLIRRRKLQPFGVNLFGDSKVGKTTGLLAATSVSGIGKESALPNWAATNNAVAETARVFNDLILPLNEVGLIGGRRADAYHKIRGLIYLFGEGRDRQRHSASQFAFSAANATWNGIFLSTAEYSFNEYAARSGETRANGEFARCLDVPAVVRGHSTIFDLAPKTISKRRGRRWARERLIELRKACEQHHGHPIRQFIKWVIAQDGIDEAISKHMDRFRQRIDLASLDGALQHAAEYFALIYAGGRLAIEAGILPWKRKVLLKAIVSSFEDAVREVRGYEDALTAAKRALRKSLQSYKFAKNTTPDKVDAKTGGCWEKLGSGKRQYYVDSKVFRGWFKNDQQRTAVVTWLDKRNFLIPRNRRNGRNSRTGTSLEWATVDHKWKDGKRLGTYVFTDPFKA